MPQNCVLTIDCLFGSRKDNSKIVCAISEASGSRQLPVQVAAYTMADVAFSVCQDSVSRCNFWYHNDATPYIATSTTSAAVGSELTFSGVLRGVNTSMYTITIGGINCDIVNEFTMTDSSGEHLHDMSIFGTFMVLESCIWSLQIIIFLCTSEHVASLKLQQDFLVVVSCRLSAPCWYA